MLIESYLIFSIIWIHFQEKNPENVPKSSLFKVKCNYHAAQKEKHIHREPCLTSKVSNVSMANKQLFK